VLFVLSLLCVALLGAAAYALFVKGGGAMAAVPSGMHKVAVPGWQSHTYAQRNVQHSCQSPRQSPRHNTARHNDAKHAHAGAVAREHASLPTPTDATLASGL
jgi:hypothetical protein